MRKKVFSFQVTTISSLNSLIFYPFILKFRISQQMNKQKIEHEVFVDISSFAIRRLSGSRTPNVNFN